MSIAFHIHNNISCKYVCHSDCSEYDGTCTNCVEIKIGVNKGKFACVHFKGHIREEDVTHLIDEMIHAHS